MAPTTRDHLADVDAKLRRRLKVVASSAIDQKDVDYVCDILMMRTALLYDLLDGSTHAKYLANWERTILGLSVLDVELYSSDWKTLREVLTSYDFLTFCDENVADLDRFKDCLAGRIHYKWIVTSTIEVMEDSGDWFKRANQWVVFDSRVNLASLDLSVSCCRDYLDFEEETLSSQGLLFSSIENDFETRCDLATLRLAAKDMFGDFIITNYPFRPKHGNGATREVKRADADPWHKNRQFAVDGDIINYLRYRCQEGEWQSQLFYPYRGLQRIATLVCVPKSMTSNRTISKEPTTLQFLQQDIFAALDDYFSSHPCHIDLHDQARSRNLALAGSRDASYATIDLSSASDSVSLAVVELLFGNLPVHYPLLATRSTHVRVASNDGSIDETIELRKFAPMGSAVCFPLECMVFSTICEAAIRLTAGRKSREDDYVVYGDDIVIRTEFAQECVRLLALLGFIVNASKSFGVPDETDNLLYAHAQFREACGIEAIGGQDVTPLRLSRRLVSLTNNDSDRQAGLGVGMIDLINRAYLYGYSTLRQYANGKLRSHKWYRSCLRLGYSDYLEFRDAIALGRPSWITAAVPYVIVDDGTDTQWRAFKARFDRTIWRCSVMVTTAKPRRQRVPTTVHRAGVYGRQDVLDILFPDGRPHDENDYFTWCYMVRLRSVDNDNDPFVIDDTGIVTIRPRDLRWSKTWVSVQRTPTLISVVHPRRGIVE